ncbi:DASS family sodium-coupled anion symporter [Rugamonas sp. FT107W]|uniref:DASS family sodium-coupled anion symporter n=1 Tax=Duganella vulcania TaxID=2692166 RepID=A0A845HQD1_9BURK|nr:DASS family sodium-coupled anion symporter [Duganella vulcania]MYN21018.1 DASS family sodium-coupled anion symporter [Duganella vulcania]
MSGELTQARTPWAPAFQWRGLLRPDTAAGRAPARALTGFILAWLALAAIHLLMPVPAGLTVAGKATLAIMAWAAIIWIFEALPVAVSGLLIPALLVLTQAVTPMAKAANGFTNPVVFLCLVAFLFSAIMQCAGLDRRIALGLLDKIKVKTVNGVIWTMFGVNLVLSFVVPAANARAATLLPVINGLTKLFGDTEQERNAAKAIVIQSLVYGSMISGMCILTAHLPNLVLTGLFSSELHIRISYLDWFKLQWPYLGMFVLTQWWVQYYFRTRRTAIPGGLETIREEQRKLPPAGKQDWSILLVFGLVALLWATEQWHKIPTENIALLGLALVFTPGLIQIKWKDIQDRTIWGTVFLLAGALSISSAISSTGLAQWLAGQIHAIAQGHPWWGILLIVMVGTHVIRLGMLSNVAAVTMLAPILLALAPKLGLHPIAFTMLVADTDSFAYLLPTQITAAVIAYSSGTFSTSDYAKVGIVSVLIAIAYGILVMAPWYAFLGIPLWDATAPWPF